MKKVMFTLTCLVAMLAASLSAKAQEITIYLTPGWNWIAYTNAVSMDIGEALGDFVPMGGDIIKSKNGGMASYTNGQWRGTLHQFTPGFGYHYYSNRAEEVSFVFANTNPQPQVTVTTSEPLLITAISALGGGEVTTNDETYILAKGLCWAAHENPMTIDDFYQEEEGGGGSFSISMTDLNISTTYYVRAYALTPNGTVYGDEKTFITRDGIPTVTTAEVTNIGAFSATCGGNVTDDGGLTVTRGVCWSTAPNPTVSDDHTSNGSGLGNYSSNIGGLNHSTTYYIRAYATTSQVTTYGEEISFTTTRLELPEGAVAGFFSVSASQQVYFSQGNLQYQASTDTWKFADYQYEYVGNDNSNISSTYSGWIDLFGWGTSGYHDSNDPYNVNYYSWSTSISTVDTIYNYYGYGPSTNMASPNLTDNSESYDWGVYNSISNGGSKPGQWRALTREEWVYVFNTRSTTSGIRYAKALVNDVSGIILLPDDWSTSIFSLNNTNNSSASFDSNTLTDSQWSVLEQAGAVFLPAAGYREETSVDGVDSFGIYWSASHIYNYSAYNVFFHSSSLNPQERFYRYYGFSVRLVAPAEN